MTMEQVLVHAADNIKVFFYSFKVAKWKGKIDMDRRKHFGRTDMGAIVSGSTLTMEFTVSVLNLQCASHGVI
jgi:hypothetical protein